MNEDTLKEQISAALDERAAKIVESDLQRLRMVRAEALRHAGANREVGVGIARWVRFDPATLMGAVASVLVVISAITISQLPNTADFPGSTADTGGIELTLLAPETVDVDLELLEQLEFYDWLELVAAKENSS